ncbi:ATP-dependent DNA ligase [Candidatus Pyrohabitans sp.]
MGTPFLKLAEVAEELSGQSSRQKKLRTLSIFLMGLEPGEVKPAVRLLLGRHPETAPLEVGWATLGRVTRMPQRALSDEPLSIAEVWNTLRRVAAVRGAGSRRRREVLLRKLFSRATEVEARWLSRCILGEMRTGVSEGLMIEAVARAFGTASGKVALAAALLGELGEVAHILATQRRLPELRIRLFTPVKPMLARPAGGLEEAVRGKVALEYKYDGARVQIHRSHGEVRVFSRRLRELNIPEVVELAALLKAEHLVVEGELIALDSRGRPLPFQDVMRSLAGGAELRLRLFDLLHLEGRDLLTASYAKRWELLRSVAPEDMLAERKLTSSQEEARRFYEKALREGHEGIVAKRLESQYEPGKRSRAWLKLKPSLSLDLAVVGAEWGHGRRRGWLSNLHLAVYHEGELLMVGKTFKGLSDAMLEEITRELLRHRVAESGKVVKVAPSLVVEVAFDEVQRSPRYPSGFALRFARVKRLRRDKSVEDADTLQTLRRIYEAQLRRKGRL